MQSPTRRAETTSYVFLRRPAATQHSVCQLRQAVREECGKQWTFYDMRIEGTLELQMNRDARSSSLAIRFVFSSGARASRRIPQPFSEVCFDVVTLLIGVTNMEQGIWSMV